MNPKFTVGSTDAESKRKYDEGWERTFGKKKDPEGGTPLPADPAVAVDEAAQRIIEVSQREYAYVPTVWTDAPTCQECGSLRVRPLAGYVAPPGSPDGLFCPNCGERAVREQP